MSHIMTKPIYAKLENNNSAGQPLHLPSLIRIFFVGYLDSKPVVAVPVF